MHEVLERRSRARRPRSCAAFGCVTDVCTEIMNPSSMYRSRQRGVLAEVVHDAERPSVRQAPAHLARPLASASAASRRAPRARARRPACRRAAPSRNCRRSTRDLRDRAARGCGRSRARSRRRAPRCGCCASSSSASRSAVRRVLRIVRVHAGRRDDTSGVPLGQRDGALGCSPHRRPASAISSTPASRARARSPHRGRRRTRASWMWQWVSMRRIATPTAAPPLRPRPTSIFLNSGSGCAQRRARLGPRAPASRRPRSRRSSPRYSWMLLARERQERVQRHLQRVYSTERDVEGRGRALADRSSPSSTAPSRSGTRSLPAPSPSPRASAAFRCTASMCAADVVEHRRRAARACARRARRARPAAGTRAVEVAVRHRQHAVHEVAPRRDQLVVVAADQLRLGEVRVRRLGQVRGEARSGSRRAGSARGTTAPTRRRPRSSTPSRP